MKQHRLVSIVHNIKSTRLQRYDIIIKLCFRPVCATQVSCVPVSNDKNKPTNSGQCTLDTKENDARGVSYASLLLIAELHARARSSIPKKIWLYIHPIKNHVIIRAAVAGARKKGARAFFLAPATQAKVRSPIRPHDRETNVKCQTF